MKATPRPPARPFEELPEHWSYEPVWSEDGRARDFALFDQLPGGVRERLNAGRHHFAAKPCYYALRYGWTVDRLLAHLDFLEEQRA